MGGLLCGSVGPPEIWAGCCSLTPACPNLCDWIPGGPRGSPLKACLYLPFFNHPPTPMKSEAWGREGALDELDNLPRVPPAHHSQQGALAVSQPASISTLLPSSGRGHQASPYQLISAPLWGGTQCGESSNHWRPPIRPTG